MTVAILGNVSRDVVAGAAPRIGGGVYYAARALAELGADAVVIARGERGYSAELERFDLPLLWLDAAETTAFTFHYARERREMTVDAIGETWTPDDLAGPVGEALDGVAWVMVAGLLRSHFPAATLAALAERGHLLLADAQGFVRAAQTGSLVRDAAVDRVVLGRLRALKLSHAEARILAGGVDDERLRALGVPEVIATLGARGARVVTNEHAVEVPPPAVGRVHDPTGAGDTFAAAYLYARDLGEEPAGAARRATEAVARFLGHS